MPSSYCGRLNYLTVLNNDGSLDELRSAMMTLLRLEWFGVSRIRTSCEGSGA